MSNTIFPRRIRSSKKTFQKTGRLPTTMSKWLGGRPSTTKRERGMPQKIKTADLQFLLDLHAWLAAGKPAYEFAIEQGVAPSTVTYRLNRYGLDGRRALGVVDRRTEVLLPQLVSAGEFEAVAPDSDQPTVEAESHPEPVEAAA